MISFLLKILKEVAMFFIEEVVVGFIELSF